jgi:ATP phosphoribosyltransferase regulatory subunit
LPLDTPASIGQFLRGQGWITVAGLDQVSDPVPEARRQLCSHVWLEGHPVPIGEKS